LLQKFLNKYYFFANRAVDFITRQGEGYSSKYTIHKIIANFIELTLKLFQYHIIHVLNFGIEGIFTMCAICTVEVKIYVQLMHVNFQYSINLS
jgi:hypothetical protein